MLHEGHVSIGAYLTTLEVMDDENKKDWEKRMWSEVTELRMIHHDIRALREHLYEKSNEVVVPKFIMDPAMREEAY